MGSFLDQVAAFEVKANKRSEAMLKSSAQDLAEIVLTPVDKGGHMRVDTGFLRSSLQGSTQSMPSINPNGQPPADAAPNSFSPDVGQINLVIAGADLGGTLYFGFTANYAAPREFKDGFVRLAAQQWESIVYRNRLKAMAAFP